MIGQCDKSGAAGNESLNAERNCRCAESSSTDEDGDEDVSAQFNVILFHLLKSLQVSLEEQ